MELIHEMGRNVMKLTTQQTIYTMVLTLKQHKMMLYMTPTSQSFNKQLTLTGKDTLSMITMTLMPTYQVISMICGSQLYPRPTKHSNLQSMTPQIVRATSGGHEKYMNQRHVLQEVVSSLWTIFVMWAAQQWISTRSTSMPCLRMMVMVTSTHTGMDCILIEVTTQWEMMEPLPSYLECMNIVMRSTMEVARRQGLGTLQSYECRMAHLNGLTPQM